MESESNKNEITQSQRFLVRVYGEWVDVIAVFDYVNIVIDDISLEYKTVLAMMLDTSSVLVLDKKQDEIDDIHKHLQSTSHNRVKNEIEYKLNK